MDRRRHAPLLAALLLPALLALTGCGGDDGGGGDDDQGSLSGGSGGGGCDASVTLTGAIEAEWDGDGIVSVGSSDQLPPASYKTEDGDISLEVSSTGNGYDEPIVLLTQGETSYGYDTEGADTLDIDPKGGGATVEVEAVPFGGGDPVMVTAEWSC